MSGQRKWKPQAPKPPVRGDCSHAYGMVFPEVATVGDECYCRKCGQRWLLADKGWRPLKSRQG